MLELPRSIEAERATIGAILLDGRAFANVADMLTAEDFYHPPHASIFAAMVALDSKGIAIDAATVWEQMGALRSTHMLKALDGEGYFPTLTHAAVTTENVRWYAAIVAGKAAVRRLVEACDGIRVRGMGDYGELGEFLDESERLLFAATSRRHVSTQEAFRPIASRVVKAVEYRCEHRSAVTGVPSGYGALDSKTAGFQPCDLVIIAARPSMGKTSLAMNIVAAAAKLRYPALVFTLEMSKEALVERMIASESMVDSSRMRTGYMESRDWLAVAKSTPRLVGTDADPVFIDIDDAGSPTVLEIRAKARRWRQNHPDGIGLVVIDYLQLIRSERRKGGNREQEVSEISRALKLLAKEIRCPVIALSQLNRGVDSRADKRPMMSDLRESGAIEQDADLILFLYRDEVYNEESPDKGIAEAIIGKQRSGGVGTVRLKFMNQYTRFESLAGDDGERPQWTNGAAAHHEHEDT